jgi:hypothetical protein
MRAAIATSQAQRAEQFALQNEMILFSTKLDTLDEDSKEYFQIMRRKVLNKLKKSADEDEAVLI